LDRFVHLFTYTVNIVSWNIFLLSLPYTHVFAQVRLWPALPTLQHFQAYLRFASSLP